MSQQRPIGVRKDKGEEGLFRQTRPRMGGLGVRMVSEAIRGCEGMMKHNRYDQVHLI